MDKEQANDVSSHPISDAVFPTGWFEATEVLLSEIYKIASRKLDRKEIENDKNKGK